MQTFQDFSIKRKLTLIMLLTSGLTLVVACGAFLVNELISSRNDTAAEVSSLSEVIAANSTAALAFRDRRGAQEILAALGSQPHIVAACIYSKDGGVFARYSRDPANIGKLPAAPRPTGAYFGSGAVFLFQDIVLDRERIGALCVWSDLRKTSMRMTRYTSIAGLVLAVSFLVAVFLSTRLQRIISGPVLKLAVTARRVTAEKDYSVRAVKLGNDEVGLLIDAFNEMLAQIAATTVSKDYIHNIIRSMGESLMVIGPDHTILTVNEATLSMLGYSEAELLGASACCILVDEAPGAAASASGVEYLYRRKDGTAVPVQFSASPMLHQDGGSETWVWLAQDITARKVADQALREAIRQAEKANRAKSDLLSRTSHELRTPLNAILGFGQLLELSELVAEDRESVDRIMTAGRHLLSLINEVLDLASLESGRRSLSREPVQIGDVSQEALDMVGSLAQSSGIEISAEIAPLDRRFVMADRLRLQQVLLNLLSNSIKYNRRGGAVTLSCKFSGPNALRLAVSDTGLGIAPEGLAKIFTPFERLGAAETGVEGTGLGLALSKIFVEAMGGSIGVESVVGEGSRFWLDLPVVEPPESEVESEPDSPSREIRLEQCGECTVLHIEDNASNLELVERFLLRFPTIRIITAMRGEQGIELARELRPDMILLDLHLPDIWGDEVLRRLRLDAATRDIPVVMLSADATGGQAQRLFDAGARSYLTKPVDCGELLKTLYQCLKTVEFTE